MAEQDKPRYRITANYIKETITNRKIGPFFEIEERRKKYFIFGPEIWVRIQVDNGKYGGQLKDLDEATIWCRRLNEDLPSSIRESHVIG